MNRYEYQLVNFVIQTASPLPYTVRTNYRFTYESMVTIVRHYTEHNMLYEHAKEILCGEPMLGCLSMLERCKYGPHIVTGSE